MTSISLPVDTGRMLSSHIWAGPWIPYILGMDGPVMSASRMPTRYPSFASWLARDAVTMDLPTPPFPLTTPIT